LQCEADNEFAGRDAPPGRPSANALTRPAQDDTGKVGRGTTPDFCSSLFVAANPAAKECPRKTQNAHKRGLTPLIAFDGLPSGSITLGEVDKADCTA
jgi:hypothetical protein